MSAWYDRHDPDCMVWETALSEEPVCTCPGARRIGGEIPVPSLKPLAWHRWLAVVRHGLDAGFSTEEIAAEVGAQYESVIRRLSRNGATGLHERMVHLRAAEHERRPSQSRCVHGVWADDDGACTHGTERAGIAAGYFY